MIYDRFKWINSIAFQLSAAIAVVVLITAVAVATLILRDEKAKLEADLKVRSLQLAEIIARQIVEPLLYEERYTIYALLQSYFASKDSIIVYAEVYDDRGQLLLSRENRPVARSPIQSPSNFQEGPVFLHDADDPSTQVFDLLFPISSKNLGAVGYAPWHYT